MHEYDMKIVHKEKINPLQKKALAANHGYDVINLGKFSDFEQKKIQRRDGKAVLVPDAQVRYDIVNNILLPKEKLIHFKEAKKVRSFYKNLTNEKGRPWL